MSGPVERARKEYEQAREPLAVVAPEIARGFPDPLTVACPVGRDDAPRPAGEPAARSPAPARARQRGQGRVFQRLGSEMFWIAYCVDGKEHRESSGSRDKRVALRLLDKRRKQIGAADLGLQRFAGPQAERVRVGELLDALASDYEVRRVRASASFRSHLKPIRAHFGSWRAVAVTEEAVDGYVRERRAAGKADATINRETQLLGQAFALALERKRITTAPKIRRLPERNVRMGTFSRPEFQAVATGLPDYLRDVALFGYLGGWRKGEIISLRWPDVDRRERVIQLRAEESKNGHPRTLALEGELLALVERRWTARLVTTRAGEPVVTDLVFHNAGRPITDFRKAWTTACARAGLVRVVQVEGKRVKRIPLKLFHDLRRTAVTNAIRAGVPEKAAMAMSGHRTRSMLDRYSIMNERDLRDATKRTLEYVAGLPTEEPPTP